MKFSGQSAIDYLADDVAGEDPGASSHWQKYHSGFRFLGNSFEGLQGFGGNEKPYRGIRLLLHWILQMRYRYMAATLPDFKRLDNLGKEITTRGKRCYNLDMLRQVLTLSFLQWYQRDAFSGQMTICVIGDGFASMTSLLLLSCSIRRVILINLTKTLLVDLWYLKLCMGAEAFESRVHLVTDIDSLQDALAYPLSTDAGQGEVVAFQAKHHELLKKCPIDLALNIVSMQEMDPPVISAYFDDLRTVAAWRQVFFYCCNREEKILPDGTVTRFASYPWHESDQVIVDELCPWHQFYYTLRPPFYKSYEGPIRHRLVKLHKANLIGKI